MTADGERRVELSTIDGVASLRLAWPEARNAIDPAMVEALAAAVAACEQDSAARAVLISAEGPAFTVGGDLRHFAANEHRLRDAMDQMVPTYHATLARLAGVEKPVVCAAQGAAAGGGLGLLWCADIVLASDDLTLATGFARIGLSGDGGSSWHLPRLVGMRRAQELLLGGRVLSAQEALEWGLVTRLVARSELESEARAAARALAAGPTVALAHMRRLLREGASASLQQQLERETAAMSASSATTDAAEGIAAFAERRAPSFEGR